MKWRRIIVALGLLFAMVYVSLYGGTISYVLFWGAFGVIAIMVCYLAYVYIEFKIYQKIEIRTLVKGQEVSYYFHLCNESKIPFISVAVSFLPDVQEVKEIEDGKEYCLLPGESVEYRTKIIAKYRGEYEMGIDSVMLKDCFELVTLTYRCKSKISVRVYPRIVKLESLAFLSDEEDVKEDAYKDSNRQEVPSGDTRAYVAGDDPKRIHWKLSACTEELIVKRYARVPQLERIVVLDLSKPEGSRRHQVRLEDKAIECAIAVIHYMLQQGIMVKVCYEEGGYRERTMRNDTEFHIFYEESARMQFHRGCKTLNAMEAVRAGTVRRASYIIITCQQTPGLCTECLKIIEEEGEASIINVEEDEHASEVGRIPGVVGYTIHPEDDLSVKLSCKGW